MWPIDKIHKHPRARITCVHRCGFLCVHPNPLRVSNAYWFSQSASVQAKWRLSNDTTTLLSQSYMHSYYLHNKKKHLKFFSIVWYAWLWLFLNRNSLFKGFIIFLTCVLFYVIVYTVRILKLKINLLRFPIQPSPLNTFFHSIYSFT